MAWTDILLSDARKHKVVLPVGTFFSNETIQLKEKTIFMAVYRGETFFVNRHGNRLLRGGKGSGKCDAGVYTYVREGKRAKADDIHKFENYYGTLQHT